MLCRAALLFLIALAVIGCGEDRGPRPDGGGATFIEPLMLKWQRVYERQTGVQVDYTGVGSGNGVQQMIHRAILFGCTDSPMTQEQRRRAEAIGGDVVHIPLVMGGVVPIYHVTGLAPIARCSFPARSCVTSSSAASRAGTTRHSPN